MDSMDADDPDSPPSDSTKRRSSSGRAGSDTSSSPTVTSNGASPKKKRSRKERKPAPRVVSDSSSSPSSPGAVRWSSDENAGLESFHAHSVTCRPLLESAGDRRTGVKRPKSNSDDSDHPRLQPQLAEMVGVPSVDKKVILAARGLRRWVGYVGK